MDVLLKADQQYDYKLHERVLKIVLNDQTSNFETLFAAIDTFESLRQEYKIQNNFDSPIMEIMLERKIIPYAEAATGGVL